MELLHKYFQELSEKQLKQFNQLHELYLDWNSKVNVISRKDIDSLYLKHVLHSLAIAKFINFTKGTKVLDIGTGGGFPGIPLAIYFPDTDFHLVDSIGKKIKVVQAVSSEIGLSNVTACHERAEKIKDQYDFVLSRAVTNLSDFKHFLKNKFKKEHRHLPIKNGVIYLKGGDLSDEILQSKLNVELHPISNFFEEDFFDTKYVMYWEGN